MTNTETQELSERIEVIEAAYEYMLAYAMVNHNVNSRYRHAN